MQVIKIKDDFIKLGQAMKLSGMADNGVLAKDFIQSGEVKVNGETEKRRGRKLVAGDIFVFKGKEVKIEN
ncbi:MAG: RNA-binding S4 domain-containing protein [Lachnospiraceae bacterium]|jgi:ribosome-associated protein|nr:RNA-binding S4 domain-containing protein [Lachnospiraceae bacterium]